MLFVILAALILCCDNKQIKKEFYSNGNLKTTSEQINGLRDGVRKEYYPSGTLRSYALYAKGKLSGLVEHYYKNGKLRSRSTWRDGTPQGLVEMFFPNDTLHFRAVYKNGLIVGTSLIFYDNGKVREKKLYDTLGNLLHVRTFGRDGQKKMDFPVPKVSISKDTVELNEPIMVSINFPLALSGDIQVKATELQANGIILSDGDIIECKPSDTIRYSTSFDQPGMYKLNFKFKHFNRAPSDTLSLQNLIRTCPVIVLDSIIREPHKIKSS